MTRKLVSFIIMTVFVALSSRNRARTSQLSISSPEQSTSSPSTLEETKFLYSRSARTFDAG
ncbi:MAG TPA: hypothetical protein VJ784_10900 [Pyrinomonadaceae bacterium]|nr:hypothetical protein [Pyrinomonadaceae bacterium]